MKGLQTTSSQSAIALLLTQPSGSSLLENLRKAHMGNYGVILSLLGCLEGGLRAKRLVDRVVDDCRFIHLLYYLPRSKFTDHIGDQVTNLREDILMNRLRYSLTNMNGTQREAHLDRAAKAIEK